MKVIKLTQGKVALVDNADFKWLNQWKWYAWCANKNTNLFYAKRTKKGILMHRVILNAKKNELTDHKDRNGLNNQRNNIRECSKGQNAANRTSKPNSSSKYLGVCFDKRTGKWVAQMDSHCKHYFLGRYFIERDAAIAYNKKAKKLHGKFANLNGM